jgi:hypothetical protein
VHGTTGGRPLSLSARAKFPPHRLRAKVTQQQLNHNNLKTAITIIIDETTIIGFVPG